MTRKAFVQKVFNRGDELVHENGAYAEVLDMYTVSVLLYDLGIFGDITSKALIDEKEIAVAKIISKSDGIFCGSNEVTKLLTMNSARSIKILRGKKDGDKIKNGDIVFEMRGHAHDLLAAERVCLNVLMRMSGIATYTLKVVNTAGKNVLIVPTRKTLWGLLDKRACYVGGGGTHRLNLSDAILIKDNHLDLLDRDVEAAVEKASKSRFKPGFIEIEVETPGEAYAAFAALEKLENDVPKAIMFDNMPPCEIRSVLQKFGKTDILFEASGGITEKNLREYAKTGVDVISMGGLTMNAPALDFSMEISR